MLANNLARGNLRDFRDFSEVAKISCYKVGQVLRDMKKKQPTVLTYDLRVHYLF